jgi:hypothetical protein
MMRGSGERRRRGHFRICAACGKRNKTRRESCTKCGQPLRGLPAALPGSVRAAAPPPRRYRWGVVAAVVVAIAAGFGVHRLFRHSALAPAGQTLPPPADPEDTAEATPAPDLSPPSAAALADARRAGERGERLLARGDARGAAPLLAEAARLSPDDARIANAYGRALLGIGSRDRALHQFERAARLSSGTVAYRLDLARALSDAGRRAEARREYEAVNALEPGHAAAAAALAGLQSPTPGAGPPSVDLGGASRLPADPATVRAPVDLGGAARETAARPAGGVFTNEDLSRGTPRPSPSIPASLRSPSPRIIRDGPSPEPSPTN